MKILKELAKGALAVLLGYVVTLKQISEEHNIPKEEVEKLLAKNIGDWRKLIES